MVEIMLGISGAGIIGLILIHILWRDEEPKKAPTAHDLYLAEWNRANAVWAQPERRRTRRFAPRHNSILRRGKHERAHSRSADKRTFEAPLPMEWW